MRIYIINYFTSEKLRHLIPNQYLILTAYFPAFVIQISIGMLIPVLPLYIQEIGGGLELIGLGVAAFLIGNTIFDIPAGFLLCLPENIDYDSMNYAWISERYKNFMYIDRISIIKEFQSKKLGTALYNDLIKCSKEENYDIILCEVNIYPPNPGSITFHKRFDFIECGSQFTEAGKKQVQFFFREL